MAFRGKPTQDFVGIQEIQNGVIVLKGGGLRAILMASSINLALKSADEQQATIMQFQNFLNVLEFSVQIYVQSRKLDIKPYLATLEQRIKEQTSEIMKIQTRGYIEFVRDYVEDTNIMTKTFYLVVPYETGGGSTSKAGLFSGGKEKKKTQEKMESTAEHRSQLEQRVSIVEQGISRTGVRVAQLGTEEIVELFYKIYNPEEVGRPMSYNKEEE